MSDFTDLLATRGLEHPSELELNEWASGVVASARAAEIEAHCADCEVCSAHVALDRRGIDGVPHIQPDAFFERVLDRARALERARTPTKETPSVWSRIQRIFDIRSLGLVAVGAAAAALIFMWPSPTPDTPLGPPEDVVRMKGDFSLVLARKTPGGAQRMASGDTFAPDDEVRFVVTLPAEGEVRIIGIESDGALYTAWPRPGGEAHRRQTKAKAKALPGAGQLDGRPGTETLHLVLCPIDVEPSCKSMGPSAAPTCPAGCRTTPFVLNKAR